MHSRVNLVHFKGVQLDPHETYMMKLTCCTWDCLLEHGAHSRHITQIGIYFILRNDWHRDVPWNISKIFCWIPSFGSTNGVNIELYDILYNMLCKFYRLWIGVLDWHIHCARVWYEIIKIDEHSFDFHLESCKSFDGVENVSGMFFFDWCRIFLGNFEICTISIFWKVVFIFLKNCLDYWITYTVLLILFSFSFD